MASRNQKVAVLMSQQKPVFSVDFRNGVLPAGSTFVRASVENDWTSPAALGQFGSGVPAMPVYDPVTGRNLGMGFWQLSNILNRWPRDLSKVNWTKSANMTAALDQTGIDGVANSASSLTASAANVTCYQTTGGGANFPICASAWVKRITGTGPILFTIDSGTTTVDISSMINSSTWTRVPSGSTVDPVGGGQWGTVAATGYGFKIVTSGDKIAVDYFNAHGQSSGGAVTFTGPTPVFDSAGSFNVGAAADVLTMPLSAIPGLNRDSFMVVVDFMIPYWMLLTSAAFTAGTAPIPKNPGLLQIDDGTANNCLFIRCQNGDVGSNFGSDINWSSTLGGSTPSGSGKVRAATDPNNKLGTLLPMQAGAFARVAVGYNRGVGMGISAIDGRGGGPTTEINDNEPGFSSGIFTNLRFGQFNNGGVNAWNGYISRVQFYNNYNRGGGQLTRFAGGH